MHDARRCRLVMRLFLFKADLYFKTHPVVRDDFCKPSIDYNIDKVYFSNVTAASVKLFFVAMCGLIMRGGDLI